MACGNGCGDGDSEYVHKIPSKIAKCSRLLKTFEKILRKGLCTALALVGKENVEDFEIPDISVAGNDISHQFAVT